MRAAGARLALACGLAPVFRTGASRGGRAAFQRGSIGIAGAGWKMESTGQLGSEKQLQVTHFVGSVQVVTGGQSAGYVLRLHSDEPLEKDARRQFATFIWEWAASAAKF